MNVLRILVVATVALGLGVPSARGTTTNVVPNPGFEQGGCGDATPVFCGWRAAFGFVRATSSHSGSAALDLWTCFGYCDLDTSWKSGSASTDSPFCTLIGPGAHPASFWSRAGFAMVRLSATFYQEPDCTRAVSYDWLGRWAMYDGWQEVKGHLVAPPGTQSALFSLEVGCYGHCGASFDDVDVGDAVELDSTPPETQITSFNDDTGDGAFVTSEFDASEPATLECSLDDASFEACQSPVSYGPLGDGSHTFRVRAIDRAGNVDPTPAEQAWTVNGAFSLSASPESLSVAAGGTGTFTIQTAGAATQTVSLSASGEPIGTGISFSPPSVVVGSSSTMTVRVPSATAPGTYTLTVTAFSANAVHTTTVLLTVNGPVFDFSIAASPAGLAVAQGASRSTTVETVVTSGPAQTVALSASGAPVGTTVLFSPSWVTAGGSSTMTISVGSATVPGTYTITVTGTGATATHATAVGLTVTEPPTARFTSSCTALTCSVDGSGSSDPDGSIASYAWDFGDGTSSSGRTATHTYSRAGSYTVTLTVTDDAGASGSASRAAAPMSLSARGYKQNGAAKVDLSWSGPSGVSFDVYRNDVHIAAVQASSYTDTVNKGHGTYKYKVCAPATASCSNERTVIF